MAQATKTVAFFGATGGTALAALELSLRAGYQCSAIVRSAEKLKEMLSNDTPTANLRIVQGDALQPEPVREVLVDPSTGTVVDTIIYGLGGRPTSLNPLTAKFLFPHICEDTTKVILSVLESFRPATSPLICSVSTTGVSGSNDVPFFYGPFYHWMLKTPHDDKGKMEELVKGGGTNGTFRDWILIRPTLLSDGEATHGQIKAGYEGMEKTKDFGGQLSLANGGSGWRSVNGNAIGYMISRKDVGAFIFEEVVVNGGSRFSRKTVTLSHW
ncbi:hypothetical protein AOL_s00215g897 [Orbilia oligospora ATCC 24927]|uniref:NAD(P)-binding domain-containing protein n=2 Tax=Orbilia oligospora TaxID=2813651 RepID=G1XV89_ARTOA|nr:hypothetical protein AOL_s00215g897 [Orbilia oligospora ATCC 24927]EGX42948.1 hypothetical protein AOL_s00215g897 [Orbilia oligospora ATCC 24927]KAF3273907.1 hypothetical protein TWF970_008316 [Orbilia oligospora]